jgi:hypothetical protein
LVSSFRRATTITTDLLWLALAFVVVLAGMLAAAPE